MCISFARKKYIYIEVLAVISNIDAHEIGEIENGNTDFYVSTLFLLAEVLNGVLSYLISYNKF